MKVPAWLHACSRMPVLTMLPWLVVPILPAGAHGDDEHHGHHAGRARAAALGGHQPHRHPLRAQPLQASLGLVAWTAGMAVAGRNHMLAAAQQPPKCHRCPAAVPACGGVCSTPADAVPPPPLLTCRTGSCRSTWRASGISRNSCRWWTHASRLMWRWMPPGVLANGVLAALLPTLR